MAYIDWTYFKGYAPGSSIPETEFPTLAERASDVVDMLTFGRIQEAGGINAFPPPTQAAIKKATAAQVETIDMFGLPMAARGVQSATIGKFSYSNGVNGAAVSPLVDGYLSSTGLLYAGVDRRC